MSDKPRDGEAFGDVLQRIAREASQLPERERFGYIQGAVQNTPGITNEADREALGILLTTAGTSLAAASQGTPAQVHLSQTIAPQQNVTNSQSVTGSFNAAGAAPSDASSAARITSRGVIIAALITGLCAIVAAYFIRSSRETPIMQPLAPAAVDSPRAAPGKRDSGSSRRE